ncbi:DinB family protein [Hamadaea tsunoensis]|uniref:DinB family protein n=1 Tax=Hamadaea tsunoensis TaxID=53368 RepID=UPI0004805C91|nr:DinB family protein [Hamadaea tsunoensis]
MTTGMERRRPPQAAGERETLTAMLDFSRATVLQKVAGLTDEQAFAAPVPPSTLTPAGIVKHLTGVERFWFSIDFAGLDLPWPWSEEDPHGGFPIAPGETIEELASAYAAECERSRSSIVDADLDEVARGEDQTFTLRYALVHMIEETARHCGHLDLLRERTDGATGH